MKQERLDFLSTNAAFTHRLAISIGALCRTMTISDVAKRMNLDWHTVKELEKEYMREQLKQKGSPSPKVIGIDEISIKKRHTYKIVVSDLENKLPIWFGGDDRFELSMDQFYAFLGEEKSKNVRLAVMDIMIIFTHTKSRRPDFIFYAPIPNPSSWIWLSKKHC